MNNGTRGIVGIAGALLLLFGVLCLNYTKMGSAERHREVARRHGWPEPSRGIAYLGMWLAPFGGGLVGFAIGRRRVLPSAPTARP
jgi:hypothetical protein